MNKYLLLSAAAAVAAVGGTTTVQASTIHFGTGSGTGEYCDYMIVTKTGKLAAGMHVGGAYCGTSVVYDAGAQDKKDGAIGGATWQFADPLFGYYFAFPAGLDFDLSKSGTGSWAIVFSSNGSTAYVLNSGPERNMVRPGQKSHTSTIAKAVAALKLTKTR